ncbi:MAG: hypothetical protein R2716_06145 [Microthrixaceae bacterium]
MTNLDANEFVGQLAICRIREERSAVARRWPGAPATARCAGRIGSLYLTENHQARGQARHARS